jgi:hypothetical protein
VSQVAADGGQVPHEGIGDDLARVEEERVAGADERGVLELRLSRERADPERAVGLPDIGEPGGIPLMSIRCRGAASRSFISGIRLCPPDRILASSPSLARSSSASPIEVGA